MNQAKLRKLAKELSLEGSIESIPKGYYCREELQKMLNRGTNYVCKFLKNLKENEPHKITSRRFKVRNSFGRVSSVPYYKIIL